MTVPLGTPITLPVTSNVTDKIHVHGYHRKVRIPASDTASASFTASAPGVLDLTLEHSKLQPLQLHVT